MRGSLQWALEFRLNFSYGKCDTVVLPKGKLEYIPSRPILMSGHEIEFENHLIHILSICS